MSKIFQSLFVLVFFAAYTASAYPSIIVNNPQSTSGNPRTIGAVFNCEAEITPRGLYAEVIFTFEVAATSNLYTNNDSLEAVLTFDLPANSFIHDSYLWLTPTTVVQADIIGRLSAVAIYEGIVKRRRDPSLLQKTAPTSYSLNVYPLKTNYPRKLQIVYSVPFNWVKGSVNIPLPTDLLAASSQAPPLNLKINTNNSFSAPSFLEANFTSMVTNSSANQYLLTVDTATYKKDLNLQYKTNLVNNAFLATYATSSNEGYYQLAIDPSVLTTAYKPRNLVVMLSHNNGNASNTIASAADIKRYLKTYLLSKFSDVDSFNLFYSNNGTVVPVFISWTPLDSISVMHAVNNIPNNILSASAQGEQLLKNGLAFCKTKPGTEAEAVLLASDNFFASSQTNVDLVFNNIKTHLGGSYSNKLNVVNYSTNQYYSSAGALKGSELLYGKIAFASGGQHFAYKSLTYIYLSAGYKYAYDLDIRATLNSLAGRMGQTTPSYNLALPLGPGFTYSETDIAGTNRFGLSSFYTETGKYYGSFSPGNLSVQVNTSNGMVSANIPITNQIADKNIKLGWINKYIQSLEGLGGTFLNEAVDSSIKNRVLCFETAFLAIETSDTVKGSVNGGATTGITPTNEPAKAKEVKCYPNPFADNLNIECEEDILEVEVYSITGSLVWSNKPATGTRKLNWNGNDHNGNTLATGIYVVKLKTANGTAMCKVQKR